MITNEKELKEYLTKLKDANWKCSICGKNAWILPKRVFQLNEFLPKNISEEVCIPLITITCSQCGNTILFNANKMEAINFDVDES